jgi:hypothetical protein
MQVFGQELKLMKQVIVVFIVTVQPLRPRGVFCERRSQKTRVFQARNYAECIISVHNRCYEAVRLNSNDLFELLSYKQRYF